MKARKIEIELYQKLHGYFSANNISKYANTQMYIKLIFALVFWTTTLVLIFTLGGSNRSIYFLTYILHCLAQLFIVLNIAHDANHEAIFQNRFLKKIMPYSFDLCGVNSYMWRELHHEQHHYCMNIDGEDESLVTRKLLRFTRKTRMKFIHRFQHLYFLILYALFSTDWIFFKDIECFFFPHTDYLKKKKHPFREYIKLIIFKIAYIGYMILLPILLFNYSIGFVFLTFLTGHFMIGLIAGTIIQISHPLKSAEFPESKKEYPTFATFVFATTADYSINSRIAEWFFGGLHLHVVHHLCPNICHVHYGELTKIIADVAKIHQVKYRINKTMFDALKDHYSHLKSLSY